LLDGCTNHIAFSSNGMIFSNVLTEIAIAYLFLSSNTQNVTNIEIMLSLVV